MVQVFKFVTLLIHRLFIGYDLMNCCCREDRLFVIVAGMYQFVIGIHFISTDEILLNKIGVIFIGRFYPFTQGGGFGPF